MPTYHAFKLPNPDELTRIRVRFETDGRLVTHFTVQLERFFEKRWPPVRLCDNAHGTPHIDIVDRRGRKLRKIEIDMTNNEALTYAIDDLEANWRVSVREFLKGRNA